MRRQKLRLNYIEHCRGETWPMFRIIWAALAWPKGDGGSR
jgi:hypothetical protein